MKLTKTLNKVKKRIKVKAYLWKKRANIKIDRIKKFLFSKDKIEIIKKLTIKKLKRAKGKLQRNGLLGIILSSRLLILFLVIILWAKANLLYNEIGLWEDKTVILYSGIGGYDRAYTNMITITYIALLIIPLMFIKKNKNRFAWVIIYDIIFSIILFADNLYYIYSSTLLSVTQIIYVKYAEEIRCNSYSFIR